MTKTHICISKTQPLTYYIVWTAAISRTGDQAHISRCDATFQSKTCCIYAQ